MELCLVLLYWLSIFGSISKKKNESAVYFNLYGDMKQLSPKSRFNIGDKVRISKYKRKVFDKGYTPDWTEEIFLARVARSMVSANQR